MLNPHRYFDPDPAIRSAAVALYAQIESLPIVSPHGHVDPALFASADARFDDPAALIVRPDHYVLRMLYSQGIGYERLLDGDPREAWRLFASHWHLFAATPSGMWLEHTLHAVFGVRERLSAATADAVYDHLSDELAKPAFSPRALFDRFNIEVLATTDPAHDPLAQHRAIRASGWGGRVIPTFRPDAAFNLTAPGWRDALARLGTVSGIEIGSCAALLRALESQRARFREMGATATDTGVFSAASERLSDDAAEAIFARALTGTASSDDAARFTGHMLHEMARMSADDGMVMQIHPGSLRNHNPGVFAHYGADRGFDIPVAAEYTRALKPLLDRFGNSASFRLILFTLDETTYARELAPLAGAYPSVLLGPPWWFHDSWNGIRRFFDQVMETAGVYNTAGFNDDTRAFPSIPARHDLWRRAAANWLGGLVARHVIGMDDASVLARALAGDLARRAYRLPGAV
jgi:glucuronate isomerase